MTRSALAKHLGCSRTTLWKLERGGVIPAGERTKRNRTIFGPAAVMAAESAIAAGRFAA